MLQDFSDSLYYSKNIPEVEATVESFEICGSLVTQAKVSLQTIGFDTHFSKSKTNMNV